MSHRALTTAIPLFHSSPEHNPQVSGGLWIQFLERPAQLPHSFRCWPRHCALSTFSPPSPIAPWVGVWQSHVCPSENHRRFRGCCYRQRRFSSRQLARQLAHLAHHAHLVYLAHLTRQLPCFGRKKTHGAWQADDGIQYETTVREPGVN